MLQKRRTILSLVCLLRVREERDRPLKEDLMALPRELIEASGMTEDELYQEIVLLLYQRERISIGKACALLGLTRQEFGDLLAAHDLTINYGVEDFEQDLDTLRRLGRI